jgi:hypothetical protein
LYLPRITHSLTGEVPTVIFAQDNKDGHLCCTGGHLVKLLLPSRAALALLLAVPWLGCSDPTGGREAVWGEIRFKGKPLDQGTIQFIPADGQDTTSGNLINQGSYVVEKKQGLKPGKYKVVISSGDPKVNAPPEEAPGAPFPLAKERIPREYNTATKQVVEVKKGEPNKFDFNIP